jgi:S-adenosylmethionine synthetase
MIASEARATRNSCFVSGEIEATELRTAFSVFARELIKNIGFLLRKMAETEHLLQPPP